MSLWRRLGIWLADVEERRTYRGKSRSTLRDFRPPWSNWTSVRMWNEYRDDVDHPGRRIRRHKLTWWLWTIVAILTAWTMAVIFISAKSVLFLAVAAIAFITFLQIHGRIARRNLRRQVEGTLRNGH